MCFLNHGLHTRCLYKQQKKELLLTCSRRGVQIQVKQLLLSLPVAKNKATHNLFFSLSCVFPLSSHPEVSDRALARFTLEHLPCSSVRPLCMRCVFARVCSPKCVLERGQLCYHLFPLCIFLCVCVCVRRGETITGVSCR